MTEKHFILFYEAGDNYLERRAMHRAERLALAREAGACGEIVLAGAYADPVDGAALVFKGETRDVAVRFAERIPMSRMVSFSDGGCANGRRLSARSL